MLSRANFGSVVTVEQITGDQPSTKKRRSNVIEQYERGVQRDPERGGSFHCVRGRPTPPTQKPPGDGGRSEVLAATERLVVCNRALLDEPRGPGTRGACAS